VHFEFYAPVSAARFIKSGDKLLCQGFHHRFFYLSSISLASRQVKQQGGLAGDSTIQRVDPLVTVIAVIEWGTNQESPW